MKHVFIITESSSLAKSLERYFRFTRDVSASIRRIPVHGANGPQWAPHAFSQIADWIEATAGQRAGGCALHNSLGIIDFCDESLSTLEELNPLTALTGDWAAVVAMLVLAFPEIHWVFITPYETPTAPLFEEAHLLRTAAAVKRLVTLHDQGFTTLFDPTGLRNMIRCQIAATMENGKSAAGYVPLRAETAAAVDEEEAYAYFNAYAAYRFGFRSHVITSQALMEALFRGKPSDEGAARGNGFSIVFEDLYLRFPDMNVRALGDEGSEIHLSNLSRRDEVFGELAKTQNRILVTVGHRRSGDPSRWGENESYLRNLRREGKWNKILYKPSSGIFDLWYRSELQRRLGHGKYKGKAEGFRWPPGTSDTEFILGGHSAPGRLLMIANRLIERAESILKAAQSVPEAVHGAVLALDALEYLGNRTPTTSLEALALKHQLEVLAECLFYGIEYNMNVKSRFQEIGEEVRSIAEWFRPRTRKRSRLNAEVRVVSELALMFRDHNQFDEEQECLARIRDLYRHLWFAKNKWVAWPIYPIRRYIDFLLISMFRFALAIIFWVILLGALYNLLRPDGSAAWEWHGYVDAMTSFFGLQPAHELESSIKEHGVWLNMAAILLGFVHLGIFISHLYSIVSRR